MKSVCNFYFSFLLFFFGGVRFYEEGPNFKQAVGVDRWV